MSISLRRVALLGLVSLYILITSGCAARQPGAGARPWLEKPPEQWTFEELRQVTTTSPWAKSIARTACLESVDTSHPAGTALSIAIGIDQHGNTVYYDVPSLGYSTRSCSRWNTYLTEVVWESSRTVCSARRAFGAECRDGEGDHVLRVRSDEALFVGRTEFEILGKSYIYSKKVGKRMQPRHVQVISATDAIFFFAKLTPEGKPLISKDELRVTFVCGGGKRRVRAEFDPPEMVTAKGRDL